MMPENANEINEMQEKIAAAIEAERPPDNDASEIQKFSAEDVQKALSSVQDGDAWIFTELHRDRFCFDHAANRWYQFTGHHWAEDGTGKALCALDGVVRVYLAHVDLWNEVAKQFAQQGNRDREKDAEKKRTSLLKRIRDLHRLNYKRDVLTLATHRDLATTGEQWDRDPWALPCVNGVVNLKTGIFRAGTPGDFFLKVAPTEWQGIDFPAPTWERFLNEIFNGNDVLVAFVRRLFGYACTGVIADETFPVLWGRGRNGKSTLLEALAHVLGPLAGAVGAELMLKQDRARASNAPTPEIMALRGRRLAWASETDESSWFNHGRVKWLTGGDTLVGREPHGRREVTFPPSHILFLMTNHKPKADPNDYAFWKRFYLIPFEMSFVNNPQADNERDLDRHLLAKLKTESSGILSWLVRGSLEWYKTGLNPPDCVLTATEKYRTEEDILGHFLADRCTEHPDIKVQSGALYKAYVAWANENGHQATSSTRFGKKIQERFKKSDRTKQGYFYLGVGLRDSSEQW